jgi:hypothetical protein
VAEASALVIACGALAKEIVELKRLNGWSHLEIQCLPAKLHNRPEKIPGAVRAELEKRRSEFEHIFVAYADCGTGGELDKVFVLSGSPVRIAMISTPVYPSWLCFRTKSPGRSI